MKNIPKICHFCWTKKAPMSLLQVISVLSFHRYNPDWKIWIHLSKQLPSELGENSYVPDYTGRDYFFMLRILKYVEIKEVDLAEIGVGLDKHGILVSDILRITMLHKYGGVYSDFDMLWLQSMIKFKNIDCIGNAKNFETTVCFFNGVSGHHNASNIISEPNGNYLNDIYKEQLQIKPPYSHQAFNSELLNRLFPTYGIIQQKYPRVIAIDYKTFYPYSIYGLEELYLKSNLSVLNDKVMGVHWFNGHQLSREYVDKYYLRRDCSMTRILIKEKWNEI